MQKPSYKELEKQNELLNKGNLKLENQFNDFFENIPKMFKIVELIYDKKGKAIDYLYCESNSSL